MRRLAMTFVQHQGTCPRIQLGILGVCVIRGLRVSGISRAWQKQEAQPEALPGGRTSRTLNPSLNPKP